MIKSLLLIQDEQLQKIIKKEGDWNFEYEQLFISLIPISLKMLSRIKSRIQFNLIDEGDFLHITFNVYDQIIKNLWANNKLIKIKDFVDLLVPNLYNNYRSYVRKYEINKKNIVNQTNNEEYDKYSNSMECSINVKYEQRILFEEFINLIKPNYLLFKIFLLKMNGKNNKQISELLNLSESTISRKIKELKQTYEMLNLEVKY